MWHRNTLTDLGPSFIKLGQVLASRPDIVREDYMEELCVLQDDVPSFPDPLVIAMCLPEAPDNNSLMLRNGSNGCPSTHPGVCMRVCVCM